MNSQNIKFKTLSTDDGLSNNSVNDIVSDKDGALWIATWDGLNLYDGYHFRVFKHIPNDSLSISGNEITEIVRDVNDSIWVLTDNRSVGKYLGNGKFQNYIFEKVPDKILLSKSGNLLVVTKGDNVYFEYKNRIFERISKKRIKRNNKFGLNDILLSKYPNLIINESLRDTKGNIWYATRNNGLYIIPNNSSNIHNEQVEHYEHDLYSPYTFTSNEIEKLYEDDFGNVWLGHKDGGLSMAYNGSQQISTVTPHPLKFPHLPNETIRSITKDFNSDIWLGYYTQGLFYYSAETKCYLKYPIVKSIHNENWDRIRSLYTSSDGSVWAGTYAGLVRIKEKRTSYYSAEDEENLPSNRNYSFFEDNKKQLWVACWGGLAKFNLNSQKFEVFKGQDKLKELRIRKVIVHENEIALGTASNGVVFFNTITGATKAVTVEDKILGNSIYSVLRDDETGYYWIASLGGITVYDTQKGVVKNIEEKDGLPSHMVYSLLLNNDKIWVSTTKGIAAIDKNNFSILGLNPNEGWQAAEFSEGAYHQDRKGTLFYGGINGLNYFSPTTIDFSTKLPRIKVVIDGNKNVHDDIEKRFMDNNLKIDITPISFTKDANNKVLYRIVEYDSQWKIDTGNPILYKDLPSGYYTLEVKNSLEKDERRTLVFNITIKKPFYKTIWFYVLILMGLLLGIAYWIFTKNRNAILYQKKLEEKIIERTQIIDKQKQNLVVVNTELAKKNKETLEQKEQLLKLHHHLKNEDFEIEKFKTFVLSEFKGPISNILEISNTLENNESVKRELIGQSGKLINFLLEWDYLNQVKDIGEQKKAAIRLKEIFKKPIHTLKEQASKSKIHLDYSIDVKDVWVELDVLRFKLLFNYLFNDIMKYSEVDSDLKVSIKHTNNLITLQIASDSKVLADNFFSVQHYSPYFRAANSLIIDMIGHLKINKEKGLRLLLDLPANIIDAEGSVIEEVQWKHLNIEEHLASDKNNILVLCEESDCIQSKQLLGSDTVNLLFENTVEGISSAIKHINIHSLVLYNIVLTDKLIQLLNGIKNKGNQITLPIIYLSEQIDYFLQEQVVDLGVDAFIQLPISKSYIQKKIIKLLEIRKDYLNEKSKQQLFDIVSEKDEILSPNEKLIKKALTIIKDNISDSSFNVERLGELLQVSKIKCYRLFKEMLKQSPSNVIVDLRLQKATYFLMSKTLNISEISFECGFNDPKYFGRLFKKKFGCSPKAYKK